MSSTDCGQVRPGNPEAINQARLPTRTLAERICCMRGAAFLVTPIGGAGQLQNVDDSLKENPRMKIGWSLCMHARNCPLCTESRTTGDSVTKIVTWHVKKRSFIRSNAAKPPFSLLDNVNVPTARPFSFAAEIHNGDFRHANVRGLLSSSILTLARRSIRAELF